MSKLDLGEASKHSPEDKPALAAERLVLEKVNISRQRKPGVIKVKILENPDWLFYEHTNIPVAVGDLVVRWRTKAELEKGGKRDQYDLFDGPWRIEKFFHTVASSDPKLAIKQRYEIPSIVVLSSFSRNKFSTNLILEEWLTTSKAESQTILEAKVRKRRN